MIDCPQVKYQVVWCPHIFFCFRKMNRNRKTDAAAAGELLKDAQTYGVRRDKLAVYLRSARPFYESPGRNPWVLYLAIMISHANHFVYYAFEDCISSSGPFYSPLSSVKPCGDPGRPSCPKFSYRAYRFKMILTTHAGCCNLFLLQSLVCHPRRRGKSRSIGCRRSGSGLANENLSNPQEAEPVINRSNGFSWTDLQTDDGKKKREAEIRKATTSHYPEGGGGLKVSSI